MAGLVTLQLVGVVMAHRKYRDLAIVLPAGVAIAIIGYALLVGILSIGT